MRRKRQEASAQSILLALRALGARIESFDDVDRALRLRKDELKERVLEPVTLAWDGRLKPSDLRLPARCEPVLVLEGGETTAWPPPQLPAGYHRLKVSVGGRVQESL